MKLFSRYREPKELPIDQLPDATAFNYREDCEYVMVPYSQLTRYRLEGYHAAAQTLTQYDGQMLILERKRV